MNYTILVCDDDREIVSAIKIYLSTEGYQVLEAYDGYAALRLLEENEIHLILMDVMMPGMDGIRATMRIRENKNIPIIILSAKSEDEDKILGLNIGADDYVTKPFNHLELLARVKSQLRRYTGLGGIQKKENQFFSGGLCLDDEQKKVTVDGDEVSLTPVEYNILKFLMQNKGRVYSSAQIYESVWKETAYGTDNIVAVHIRHLREKIEINPKEPKYIKVMWGHGYKLESIEATRKIT